MDFFSLLTIFILSCFIGFYVVWSVTPALHSPLMSITNAISSVIIVGAMIVSGSDQCWLTCVLGSFASLCAFINIFGGFLITHRMLDMFKKKKK